MSNPSLYEHTIVSRGQRGQVNSSESNETVILGGPSLAVVNATTVYNQNDLQNAVHADPIEVHEDRPEPMPQRQGSNHQQHEEGINNNANDIVEEAITVPPIVPVPRQQVQMPDDLAIIDNELHGLKAALDYESKTLAKGAIPLIVCSWILLYFPAQDDLLIYPARFTCTLLTLWTTQMAIRKPDIRSIRGLSLFETRLMQMISISLLCTLLENALNLFVPIPQQGPFPNSSRNANEFKTSWNSSADSTWDFILRFLNLWGKTNFYFLMVSSGVLLLIDVPLVLYKSFCRSALIQEILTFEVQARGYPLLHMVSPFLLMNAIAYLVPPQQQYLWMWAIIHVIAMIWIGVVVYGILDYPDIPLARPMGLEGYVFIETATIIQMITGVIFSQFIGLARSVYFQVYPGGLEMAVRNPVFLMGPHLYLRQILLEEPPETWKHQVPYPVGFELFDGLFFWITLFRHLKLASFMQTIHERIESASAEL